MKTKFGRQLKFISKIKRDGSGIDRVFDDHVETLNNENFDLSCLSMTEKTFIASGFNSYIVKIKDNKAKRLSSLLFEMICNSKELNSLLVKDYGEVKSYEYYIDSDASDSSSVKIRGISDNLIKIAKKYKITDYKL